MGKKKVLVFASRQPASGPRFGPSRLLNHGRQEKHIRQRSVAGMLDLEGVITFGFAAKQVSV
jgi:hypothetical protein